jgi:LAS superfamily LD-carboxypeptidase LdcB
MHVVEPKNFSKSSSKEKYRRKMPLMIGILFIVIALTFVLFRSDRTGAPALEKVDSSTPPAVDGTVEPEEVTDTESAELRMFTDNEFNAFYNNLLQPNLERVENPPFITGDDVADTRIRQIAENRGYRLRASPSNELIRVDGYLLHDVVQKPWEALQAAAAAEGHNISIVSGYRSVEDQRQLFVQRLQAAGATIQSVARGDSDAIVNTVLITSSIPGYSKHHTGYTIDLLCAGFAFENFENSTCNGWLIADNYKVAKEYGFIPSYPPEADAQGPDPEAWEYVYVGRELLYQ